MNDVKLYRIFNSVIIVENGCKKIITDKSIITKSNNEILHIYNSKRQNGGDKNE